MVEQTEDLRAYIPTDFERAVIDNFVRSKIKLKKFENICKFKTAVYAE